MLFALAVVMSNINSNTLTHLTSTQKADCSHNHSHNNFLPAENQAEKIRLGNTVRSEQNSVETLDTSILQAIIRKNSQAQRYQLKDYITKILAPIQKQKMVKNEQGLPTPQLDANGQPVYVPVYDVCTCEKIPSSVVHMGDYHGRRINKIEEANKVLEQYGTDVRLDDVDFSYATIMYNTERHTANQRGMHRCKKVWLCPVCSSKIALDRADYISQAIRSKEWNTLMLVTFTTSHRINDSLATVREAQSERFEKLMRDGSLTKWLRENGLLGKVTTKEVTCTKDNGWHPHYHVLFFLSEALEDEELKKFTDFIKKLWVRVCKGETKTGKPFKHPYKHKVRLPSYERGVDVQYVVRRTLEDEKEAMRMGEYVSGLSNVNPKKLKDDMKVAVGNMKVNPAYEMTHHHKKNAFADKIDLNRRKGFTPFQLAMIANMSEEDGVDDLARYWARKRFVEFAECYVGVKQLVFSKGFGECLGIEEAKDFEAAETLETVKQEEETEKKSVEVFHLETDFFRYMLTQSPLNIPRLYELTERSIQLGSDDVKEFLTQKMGEYVGYLDKTGKTPDKGFLEFLTYFQRLVMPRDLREYVEEQHKALTAKEGEEKPIDWGNTKDVQEYIKSIESDKDEYGIYAEYKPTIIPAKYIRLPDRDKAGLADYMFETALEKTLDIVSSQNSNNSEPEKPIDVFSLIRSDFDDIHFYDNRPIPSGNACYLFYN